MISSHRTFGELQRGKIEQGEILFGEISSNFSELASLKNSLLNFLLCARPAFIGLGSTKRVPVHSGNSTFWGKGYRTSRREMDGIENRGWWAVGVRTHFISDRFISIIRRHPWSFSTGAGSLFLDFCHCLTKESFNTCFLIVPPRHFMIPNYYIFFCFVDNPPNHTCLHSWGHCCFH